MPGIMHNTMGVTSYKSLPDWQRKEWAFPEENISKACLIPDDMGWEWTEENFRRYKQFLLSEEILIPHGPPDRDFNPAWISGQEHDQNNFLLLLRYYTKKFVETLNKKEFDLSLVFAGILAHIIQESCFPSHTIPNVFFYRYYHSNNRCSTIYFHNVIDDINLPTSTSKPILLGTSPEEISFRLWLQMENHILWSKKNLLSVLQSIETGENKYLKKILQVCSDKAVKLVADTWYSCICYSFKKWNIKEIDKLKEVSLVDFVPYFYHPCDKYWDIGNYSIEAGKKQPLFILKEGRKIKIKKGLGITSLVSLKYLIDSKIFPVFRCRVGVSPLGWKEEVKKTGVKFIIETDTDINREYRPDVNYKNTKKVFEQELIIGKIVDINVSVKGAKTLIISTLPSEIDIGGQKKYLFPNIVIAEPSVCKDETY